MNTKQLLDALIASLEDAELWDIDTYKVVHAISGISIWVANRPYADMRFQNPIDSAPFGFFQRMRLRKAVDAMIAKKIASALAPV